MSGALEKNRRALRAVGGDAASPDLIRAARIGVWFGDGPAFAGSPPSSAVLAAEALGELLGRFWYRIDAEGSCAVALLGSAKSASMSCSAASDIRRRWEPPYDFALGVGEGAPPGSARDSVAVGAGGWTVTAGSGAVLGGGANPAGPLAAAAIAAAEAIKSVFSIGEARGAARLPDPYEWSAWPGAAAAALEAPAEDAELDLGEVHVFGVGAVSHALLWLLRRWPGGVRGRLHLVDPDEYDDGNPQRYLGAAAGDVGRPKASSMAGRMRRACPGLDVEAHDTDMNDYFTERNPECRVWTAVCGLDSKEGRRQLALKLSRTTVNMWTSEFHAGASTFSLGYDGWPCMLCAYPEPAGVAQVDEASSICRELGLAPHRVRELLDSGRSIGESDAKIIGATTGVDPGAILLKPVRTVRTEMCATGRIAARGGRGGADIQAPLAFASAMAGVAGFAELVRAVRAGRRGAPEQFQTSVLKFPTQHSWGRRGRSPGCRHCSAPVRRLARAKYAQRPGAEAAAQ